jgi:hypothetical protein
VQEITLTFKVSKITPGTHQFKEPQNTGLRPAVGTIYITNAALAVLGMPDEVVVTIKAAPKQSEEVESIG